MILVIVVMTILPVRLMRHVPLEYNRKVQGAISFVTKFLEELIQERKRNMFMNVDNFDYLEKNGGKDIISLGFDASFSASTRLEAGPISCDETPCSSGDEILSALLSPLDAE